MGPIVRSFFARGGSEILAKQQTTLDRILRLGSSLKCGLVLLGLLGIAVITGTLILQRPMAPEGQIEQIYAPQTVRILNALGLFDVFHSTWFMLLLALLGANIALASLDRFPQVWRLFARPRINADPWFVRQLPFQKEISLGHLEPEPALSVAIATMRDLGFRPKTAALASGTLYAEKHRIARLAPYVVHASLLIIFAGSIVDGLWGFRGFMSLTAGSRAQTVESSTGSEVPRRLGFTLRCDAVGMESYPDGSPKQYWSKLAIEENGREVLRKEIHVNEPLTYRGMRFFQASYGPSGSPDTLILEARWAEKGNTTPRVQTVNLRPGEPTNLNDGSTQVELADFIPDFVLEGNQITTRSNEPHNPAIELKVTRAGGKSSDVWIFPKAPNLSPPNDSGIIFQLRDLAMLHMTGLQVAHEPGQNLIWAGCLLLTAGLMMALYLSHVRVWGVIGRDRRGQPALLLGGQPSKYRESFERRFLELAAELETAFQASQPEVKQSSPA